MVGGHIATKADVAMLDEHKSDVQKQWDGSISIGGHYQIVVEA